MEKVIEELTSIISYLRKKIIAGDLNMLNINWYDLNGTLRTQCTIPYGKNNSCIGHEHAHSVTYFARIKDSFRAAFWGWSCATISL